MNYIDNAQIPDSQEGVKDENIISKKVTRDTMKKNKITVIFYSLVGGALIGIGLLFLLSLLVTGIKNTASFIVTAVTFVFASIFLWIAYKT